MSELSWTARINQGGWQVTWESDDATEEFPHGGFNIKIHVGPGAKYDYGVMSGEPYELMQAISWPDGTLAEVLDEEGPHIWRYIDRYATFDEAVAAAAELRKVKS